MVKELHNMFMSIDTTL